VNRPNVGTVNASDHPPALDQALCVLATLPKLLLDLVVAGRLRRDDKSQDSNQPNHEQEDAKAEAASFAHGRCCARAGIALDHAIHGSELKRSPSFDK